MSSSDALALASAQLLRRIEQGGSTQELVAELHAVFAQLSNRERFLDTLAAATRSLVDPRSIMQTSARLLAEHLGVERCAYANVDNEAVFDIIGDHARGVPSIVGRWNVADFGPACVADMLANRPYVVEDIDTDPRIPPEFVAAYRATTIRAVICVPLHKQGRFTAAMAVHQTSPRRWTGDEIDLVATVVGRCWEALERSSVEHTLADNRARLDYAAQLSGIGFWYCDLPFDELTWDVRVKQHFFLPEDARVTIELFYDRIHPDDRESTRTAIDSSIANHESYDVIYRTVDPATGAHKFIRALGGTAYDPEGAPLRFDGVTIDVTAQKRAEERLRDQDRRKDEFLATLAHELRNPLAPIRTGLEILQVTEDTATAQHTQRMMTRQLGHLVRMVDDLLDISRVTLGKVHLVEDDVAVHDIIASAVETVRSQLEASGIELVRDLAAEPLVVHGDPTRLAQIISNLLSNAVKHTPRSGRITISATRRDDLLELAVRDTGTGIPQDKLDTVFEMFAQLGQSIDRARGGLGIGLTLARRLAELHGGTIEGYSEGVGRGSTFIVRLPLRPAPAPAPSPVTVPVSSNRRILVVDDNLDAADALSALLEISGHDVRVAHTGREALEVTMQQHPEIILLDIGLPELDGYEVARRIRADVSIPQPLLVALTGWGAAEDRRKAREAGFDEHLVKPVEHARLTALIAKPR